MHINVKTTLETAKVPYKVYKHAELPGLIKSPADFSKAIGYSLDRITKSLFVRSVNKDKYAIVVCPMNRNINFDVIAKALSCPRVEVASKDELNIKVGYPPNGVSPIGAKDIPVFVEKSLLNYETLLLGAGEAGVEVEISPHHLVKLTTATVGDFSK